MKNFGLLILVLCCIGFNQCKEKKVENGHDHSNAEGGALVEDYHCYKYYKMKVSNVSRPSGSLLGTLRSDGKSYAFIIGSDFDTILQRHSSNVNYEYNVYHFNKGNNKFQNCEALFPNNLTVLISKNDAIAHNTSDNDCNPIAEPELRGDFGCNPKLLYKDNAILNFTVSGDNEHKYIPFPSAFHHDLNGEKVANILNCYCFKISNNDFIQLNTLVINSGHKNHELGLYNFSGNRKELKIYNPGEQDEIGSFEEK